jgi:hypothetical protein
MLWTDQHILLLAVLPIETCIFPRPLALDWELYHNMCTFSISPTLHRYDLLADVYFYFKSIGAYSPGPRRISSCSLKDYTSSFQLTSKHKARPCYRKCPLLGSAWKLISNLPTLVTLMIRGGYRIA